MATNIYGDEIESPAPAAAAPDAPRVLKREPRFNEYGDEIVEARVVEADAQGNLPTNEYGDLIEHDAAIYQPPAGAQLIRDPNASTAVSTIKGGPVMRGRPGQGFLSAVMEPLSEAHGGDMIVRATPTLARVGGVVGGVALAPFTGGASLPVGLSLAIGGAAAAEPIAQELEVAAEMRDEKSYDEGVLNVAVGAPAAMIGLPGASTVTTVGQRLLRAGAHAVAGGAVNVAQGEIQRAAHLQERNWRTRAQDFGLGAGFGAVLGTSFDELARAGRLGEAYNAARAAGFRGNNTEGELRAWMDANLASRTMARMKRAEPAGAAPASVGPEIRMETTRAPEAASPSPAAASPEMGAPATPTATAATQAPTVSADDFRTLARTERAGALGRLSDQQLASLSEQLGTRARNAAGVASLPAPQTNQFGDEIEQPAPATRPAPAKSFDELAQLWDEVGVKLKFNELPNGDTELSVINVPEAQRGQGVGSVVLQEVKDVAEILGKPVQLIAKPFDFLPKGKPGAEGEAEIATYNQAKNRLGAWYDRNGFARVNRGTRVVKTRTGDEVRERDPMYRYVPGTVKPGVETRGVRPGFGARPDGVEDLLDDIYQLGGAPKPPTERGASGEWDGWEETFGGPASRLLVHPRRSGNIDRFVAELNDTGKYRFASPDDFYSAVGVALEERTRAKARAELEQNQAKFYTTALENKARGGRPAGPAVPTDELAAGDQFQVRGAEFAVREVTEDGRVIAQDGPEFGTVELPPGTMLHPDKGTLRKGDAAEQAVNEWGDLVEPAEAMPDNSAANDTPPRASSGAAASPGSASAEAYPGPDAFTAPADDPTFTQLAVELPEAVQFYRQLSGGQYPKIREKLRVLAGNALGVFYHTDGPAGVGKIELKADIFQLVSKAERRRLLAEATAWAERARADGSTVSMHQLIEGRFNQLVKAAELAALTQNPKQALAVFWHEIGHFVDWRPDKNLKRGNLLGHLAALKNHLKPFLAEHPGMDPAPKPITPAEQAKLRRQAEKDLAARVTEVVEIIRREEPVYRELPITADNITSILKNAQRDEFPGLYDWFAGLERADKAAVLRKAMKGVVDEGAAQFSRREPTGETRTVEEEKRTQTGVPATPEEIRARFEELLRAELRARGLISEREIRAEADTVMKWWQGVDEVPKYFRTATETWAELFSALMNNPAGVAKRAPTFFRAFNNYLEARPEVAKIYRDVQDSIKSGAVHRERVLNLREMWHRDEDNSLLSDSMFQAMDGAALRDTLSLLFNRQTGPIQRRALDVLKKDKGNRVAAQALSGLKNYLYRATGWESFARDLNLHVEAPLAAANLHHDDMSEMLFHSRIAGGDRQQLANPLGWSPKTSAERLQAMEAELGPQRWAALEEAAVTFRAIYEEQVLPLLRESGMLTPELMQIIEDRTLYATFAKAREFNPLEAGTLVGALENRYGKDVTSRIYRQIGTLGEIRSPYLATLQKAFSLIATARRQIANKSIIKFLEEHEPQSVIPAQERFVDGRWEPVPMETRQVGTIYTLEKGKPEAYYVPRPIAEMMSHGSPMESQIVGLAHKALAWPKAILTELNPGFWPVAFAKDVATLAMQLPKGVGALKQIPAGFMAARASMTSKPSLLADDALRRLMVISRADSRGEHLGRADELTRVLMRMGQTPQLWDAEAEKIGRLLRGWMAWKGVGQTLERTIKFAGMKHLDEAFPGMPEWEKKRIVNEQAGSPDFLEKGRAAPVVDLWMMFYNPWLRGLEAMKTSAGKDPRGFWTKFLATVGLAGTAYWMFENGLIDGGLSPEEAEDKRDMMRSIPERDKRRGFAIPLEWADKDQGKVAYVVLPFPDSLRYLHTGQRTMLQSMDAERPPGESLQSFLSYQGQDLPGSNPMITEAGKWYDYHVLGRNPYDEFLGRGALPEDMVTAREGGTELALQSLSNVTGGIVYRHRQDRPGETPTGLEKFLQTPLAGNLLGRWLRVSNRGLYEQTERDVAPARQREAELRLVAEEMIGRQIRGEAWTPAMEQLYTEEPYLAQRIVSRRMDLMKQATAPEMRAWEQAKSTGEKTALLDAWAKREAARAERLEN